MGEGKAKNVVEYLDNLIDRGKATPGAIRPLKIAFTKVVQTIDGENWEDTDVRSIDVEDYMSRFANLTMGRYASDSLTVYKSRVNKVVAWYIQFLDTPGWAPDVQRRNSTSKAKNSGKNNETKPLMAVLPQNVPQAIPSITNAADRILYPYPLSDGQLIQISLPVNLTKQDAKRIGFFIESIALDLPRNENANEQK